MSRRAPFINGSNVKLEPVDPLSDPSIVPKEFDVAASQEDSDCEDLLFFSQIELDNTRKCLDNSRLVVKDLETQLDWHLQQYVILRSNPHKEKFVSRQDLLSMSRLVSLIMNHPEGNKNFLISKRPNRRTKGKGVKRGRRANKDESESSGVDSDGYEDVGDPKGGSGSGWMGGHGKRVKPLVVPKDEIEEEPEELLVPKEELDSDKEIDTMQAGGRI